MATTLIQPGQEQWDFGVLTRATRGTVRRLHASVTAAAGVLRVATLREFRTTAGYQVPAGFVYVNTRIRWSATAIAVVWFLSDGTTDVGAQSAAAPAGQVAINDPLGLGACGLMIDTVRRVYEQEYYFTVPAGRFMAIEHNVASDTLHVELDGIEVAL